MSEREVSGFSVASHPQSFNGLNHSTHPGVSTVAIIIADPLQLGGIPGVPVAACGEVNVAIHPAGEYAGKL